MILTKKSGKFTKLETWGYFIIHESQSEHEAFDFLYEIVLDLHKTIQEIKFNRRNKDYFL